MTSIYEHVAKHRGSNGRLQGGHRLPDEDEAAQQGLKWAPGALEGAIGRHTVRPEDQARAQADQVHSAVVDLCDKPSREQRDLVEDLLRRTPPRNVVDEAIELLRTNAPKDLDRFREEMRDLLLNGTHRDQVKWAIALTALRGDRDDAELFRTIGSHDEFTLYAAIALAHVTDNHIEEWIRLARAVDGWGKVEIIDLLLRAPTPEVCSFLLREGLPPPPLDAYVALGIAKRCDLAGALSQPDPDPELLARAGSILATLAEASVSGGPAGGLDDYPDAPTATVSFLDAIQSRAGTLEDFIVVDALLRFVTADDVVDFVGAGSSANSLETARTLALRFMGRPEWPSMATKGMHETDEIPWAAISVAKRLGLPIEASLVRHLKRNPLQSSLWWHLAEGDDVSAVQRALDIAHELLDLKQLASGPADELGLGSKFELHRIADLLLQTIRQFPGTGSDLVRYALDSPVIRNRNLALNVLREWPKSLITQDLHEAVKQRADKDPHDSVRKTAAEVLAGPNFRGASS